MSIIDANVNIMDRTGTIIASGDPSRIGQLHDGARSVIERKLPIEITSEEAEQWLGTQPGINLPITFQERIVGVIGITGEPDEIRAYSKLIQMGAELTLEQAFLTNEIQRNKQIRHHLIANIFLGSENEQEYILERAQYVKLNTNETFSVILISPSITDEIQLRNLENQLKTWLRDGDEYVQLFTNEYIILKKHLAPNLDTSKQLKSFIKQKHATLTISNVTITIGPFSKGIQGWRQSYNEAKNISDVATILYPAGGVWEHNDLELAILCNSLWKNSPEEASKIIDTYKLLFLESDGADLHETLLTYVHENGKMANTADKLFIHRNTLAYRLEKIHAITGKNPKNVRDLLDLMMAQLLYLLTKNQ